MRSGGVRRGAGDRDDCLLHEHSTPCPSPHRDAARSPSIPSPHMRDFLQPPQAPADSPGAERAAKPPYQQMSRCLPYRERQQPPYCLPPRLRRVRRAHPPPHRSLVQICQNCPHLTDAHTQYLTYSKPLSCHHLSKRRETGAMQSTSLPCRYIRPIRHH